MIGVVCAAFFIIMCIALYFQLRECEPDLWIWIKRCFAGCKRREPRDCEAAPAASSAGEKGGDIPRPVAYPCGLAQLSLCRSNRVASVTSSTTASSETTVVAGSETASQAPSQPAAARGNTKTELEARASSDQLLVFGCTHLTR